MLKRLVPRQLLGPEPRRTRNSKQFYPSGRTSGLLMAASVTSRSHTRQEIPAGTPAARAFDPCSVAAPPERRPLKRHSTFAPQRQTRLPGRGCCTGLPANRRRHNRWCLRLVNSPRGWWRYWSFARSRSDVTLHNEHVGSPATSSSPPGAGSNGEAHPYFNAMRTEEPPV